MTLPDDSPRAGIGIDARGIKFTGVPDAKEPPAFWYGCDDDGYLIAVPATEMDTDLMRFNMANATALARPVDWRDYRFTIAGEEYAARFDLTAMPATSEPANVSVTWASVAGDSTRFYWDGATLFRSVDEEGSA